jgi:hypothetical protein
MNFEFARKKIKAQFHPRFPVPPAVPQTFHQLPRALDQLLHLLRQQLAASGSPHTFLPSVKSSQGPIVSKKKIK